nr:uncharacterized protein LOC4337737 isoform X1 [Oryza sativa Japonica Group]
MYSSVLIQRYKIQKSESLQLQLAWSTPAQGFLDGSWLCRALLAPPFHTDSCSRLPPPLMATSTSVGVGKLLSRRPHNTVTLASTRCCYAQLNGEPLDVIAQTTMGNNNIAFEGLIFGCPHLSICRIQPVMMPLVQSCSLSQPPTIFSCLSLSITSIAVKVMFELNRSKKLLTNKQPRSLHGLLSMDGQAFQQNEKVKYNEILFPCSIKLQMWSELAALQADIPFLNVECA